jgi:hypothetical protein
METKYRYKYCHWFVACDHVAGSEAFTATKVNIIFWDISSVSELKITNVSGTISVLVT